MATLTALFASVFLFLSGPVTAAAPDCDTTACSVGNGWASPGDRDPNDGVDPNRK